MKIAVEGCCHGELDKIYETIAHLEQKEGIKVDLLLCCGDFQAVRNPSDLRCMAVPPKYQRMNTFYKYYSGEKVAPILTVFIGGNHEASNYLQELPYGGWVAPNIYYMGYATVLNFRGVRIGGLSGIFKGRDFNRGHYERLPYTEDSKRSVYHIRNLEVFRMKQISRPVDIFLSHDWPTGVYNHGDVGALLKRKPFFREEIERNELGSPPAAEVLSKLKPSYWFAAHLHVKFAAIVDHNEDNKHTRFLSLDKCLPKRKFLQVVDIPHDAKLPAKLALDPEWLCILKSTNHLLSLSRGSTFMPGPGGEERYDFTVTDQEIRNVEQDFNGMFTIPENFVRTAPAYTPEPGTPRPKSTAPPEIHVNEQTTLLCDMLDLTDPNAVFTGANVSQVSDANVSLNVSLGNPAEISLEDDDDLSDDEVPDTSGYLSEQSFTCSTPSQTPGTGKKRLLLPSPSNTSLDALDVPPPVNTSLDNDDTDESSGTALPAFRLDSLASCDSPGRDSGCSPSSRKHSEDIELSRDQSLLDVSVKDASLELLNSSASLDSSINTSDLDASRSDIDPDVPSRKKFKRRNQSMYTATEDA